MELNNREFAAILEYITQTTSQFVDRDFNKNIYKLF